MSLILLPPSDMLMILIFPLLSLSESRRFVMESPAIMHAGMGTAEALTDGTVATVVEGDIVL